MWSRQSVRGGGYWLGQDERSAVLGIQERSLGHRSSSAVLNTRTTLSLLSTCAQDVDENGTFVSVQAPEV